MSTGGNHIISRVNETDFSSIRELALKNGGNKNLTEKYIRHWYMDNPIQSYSMYKAVVDGNTEGYATTNNFWYDINGKETLVAMPQNLLTSYKIRGKGIFGELYRKTEAENIAEKHIDHFIVFSNRMSTPIFLNKLDYARAQCPPVHFSFWNPLHFFASAQTERLELIDQIDFNQITRYPNAMIKTAAYFKWRYENYDAQIIHILAIKKNKSISGYAILKSEKKKRVPMLVVMDIITSQTENIQHIVNNCSIYASKKGFGGLLYFEIPVPIRKGILSLKIQNRFNLLVKGKDTDTTKKLKTLKYNFFFGDLDIL